MTNIQIATPSHFATGRLQKIGFFKHELFIAIRLGNSFEVWRVHCLVPSSWCKVYSLQAHELFYSYFTLSVSDNCVYALILAILEPDQLGQVMILRINPDAEDGRASVAYTLSLENSTLFDQVGLESMGFGCGRNKGLYIYDRSIVMGPIPFWRICFNEQEATFSIGDHRIVEFEENGLRCSRFPVVVDGDRRLILKLTTSNEVALYDEDAESWSFLAAHDDTDLDLSSIRTRIITETYGNAWHRCGLIESPLSVFADDGYCIFKIYHNGLHEFYNFEINEDAGNYCLRKCSRTRIEKRLQARFYLHCADGRRVAFVNKNLVGFVDIQPATLKELSFWAFQQTIAYKDEHNLWCGGKSEAELRDYCHLSRSVNLL